MNTHASALASILLVTLVACGGRSTPTAPPTPAPPASPSPPPAASTTGRVVNALNMSQGIGGARIVGDVLSDVEADAAGQFTVQAASAASFPLSIRVTASSAVERRVFLKIPGEPVTISMMPSSIPLTYFDEMCRSFGAIARWTSVPVLAVETSVLEYGSRVATDDVVPDAHVQRTIAELRQVLPILSAGRFTEFAAIDMRRTAEGSMSFVSEGTIGLTWQTNLAKTFGHVAYGARLPGPAGMLRGEVALDHDWHVDGLPAGSRRDFFNVVQHEFGHALGYSHTKTAPSFMYEVFLMTVSALDRQAFEIFMQRPNGNQTPDADPSGTSLNLQMDSGRMHVERCESLRVK